jgi:hypothetical protein
MWSVHHNFHGWTRDWRWICQAWILDDGRGSIAVPDWTKLGLGSGGSRQTPGPVGSTQQRVSDRPVGQWRFGRSLAPLPASGVAWCIIALVGENRIVLFYSVDGPRIHLKQKVEDDVDGGRVPALSGREHRRWGRPQPTNSHDGHQSMTASCSCQTPGMAGTRMGDAVSPGRTAGPLGGRSSGQGPC